MATPGITASPKSLKHLEEKRVNQLAKKKEGKDGEREGRRKDGMNLGWTKGTKSGMKDRMDEIKSGEIMNLGRNEVRKEGKN